MSIRGYYPLNAFVGIAVLEIDNDIEDRVCFCWVNDKVYSKKSWAKIRYDKEGNPFFVTHGYKIPFSEILRYNIS